MSIPTPVFGLTIFAYRKEGMEEEEYHRYLSESHAQTLKDLLVKNKIIGYTMVRTLKTLCTTRKH
jgi:hypothetical protein